MTSLSYCIESTVLSETSRRGRPLHASLHARRGHPRHSRRRAAYQDGESRLKSNGKKATYSTELHSAESGRRTWYIFILRVLYSTLGSYSSTMISTECHLGFLLSIHLAIRNASTARTMSLPLTPWDWPFGGGSSRPSSEECGTSQTLRTLRLASSRQRRPPSSSRRRRRHTQAVGGRADWPMRCCVVAWRRPAPGWLRPRPHQSRHRPLRTTARPSSLHEHCFQRLRHTARHSDPSHPQLKQLRSA